MKHLRTVLVYPARKVGDQLEYLMLRRIKARGGIWQGVTGRVEEDEGVSEAARRELVEETSFDPLIVIDLNYSYSFLIKDEWRSRYPYDVDKITVFAFAALVEADQDPLLDPHEHDQWLWCNFEGAMQLVTWPDNQTALKLCDNELRSLEN
ncbi:MAG: NUDIX pyrophosphatase [Anaerolineaceae bacterium]|nr:MAG: NUDIX pyrophosphatase [Anaerolineaceae bacterium]